MKKDWNTTEGKKFIAEVDVDWSSQVDKYVRILNAMCDMLEQTTVIYSDLNSKIRTIKF